MKEYMLLIRNRRNPGWILPYQGW